MALLFKWFLVWRTNWIISSFLLALFPCLFLTVLLFSNLWLQVIFLGLSSTSIGFSYNKSELKTITNFQLHLITWFSITCLTKISYNYDFFSRSTDLKHCCFCEVCPPFMIRSKYQHAPTSLFQLVCPKPKITRFIIALNWYLIDLLTKNYTLKEKPS